MSDTTDSLAGFSAEESAVVEAVRRFVARDVRPQVARLEREAGYPEALVAAMRALGVDVAAAHA